MNGYQKLAVARVEKLVALEPHYLEAEDSPQSTLRDIMTDLRHFADAKDLDFYKAMTSSHIVYLEERR